MKLTLFQIYIKTIFPQLFQDPLYDIYKWLAEVFGIDQNIIQIHVNKDIKFLNKNLVNIILKTSWCIKKTKKQDLVLKVTVSGTKGCFLLITFSNSHPMIGTNEIQIYKSLDPIQIVQGFSNQRQGVPIFDWEIVQTSIIQTQAKTTIRFLGHLQGTQKVEQIQFLGES